MKIFRKEYTFLHDTNGVGKGGAVRPFAPPPPSCAGPGLISKFLLYSGYESIGCYRDTGNRAILPLEGKDSILDGRYWTRKNPIAKCAAAARRAGYSMFAVQNGGWCAASATAGKTFNKYGKSTACGSDGEGGPWANQVYVIKG